MKHGKAPTRAQKQFIRDRLGLNPENWLVVKDNPMELVLVHRLSGKQRIFKKGGEEDD